MGVVSGCGEQEVGAASGSGWNLWVWLQGVVVRRYIDLLSLLLLYLFFFTAASLLFVHFCKCFSFLLAYLPISMLLTYAVDSYLVYSTGNFHHYIKL